MTDDQFMKWWQSLPSRKENQIKQFQWNYDLIAPGAGTFSVLDFRWKPTRDITLISIFGQVAKTTAAGVISGIYNTVLIAPFTGTEPINLPPDQMVQGAAGLGGSFPFLEFSFGPGHVGRGYMEVYLEMQASQEMVFTLTATPTNYVAGDEIFAAISLLYVPR